MTRFTTPLFSNIVDHLVALLMSTVVHIYMYMYMYIHCVHVYMYMMNTGDNKPSNTCYLYIVHVHVHVYRCACIYIAHNIIHVHVVQLGDPLRYMYSTCTHVQCTCTHENIREPQLPRL